MKDRELVLATVVGLVGGAFKVGGGVGICLKRIYAPDPEYSEEASQRSIKGTSSFLWLVVGPDGRARNIRVTPHAWPRIG